MRTIFISGGIHEELLPFHLITVGTGHNQEPRHRPNGANFHHIMVVEKGTGIFESVNRKVALSEGTAMFIHKEIPISYYNKSEDFQTGWVTFDGPFTDTLLKYFHAKDFVYCKSEETASLIVQCYHLTQKGASPERLSQALYEIIITFFTELYNASSSPHVNKAKEWMETHYMEDLSVEEVALAVGISQSLLYRLFHEEEHTTPVAYLQQVRMLQARQLLMRDPEMKIAEVAVRCGYSDCAYFCKLFKANTHMTPKAFRSRYAL